MYEFLRLSFRRLGSRYAIAVFGAVVAVFVASSVPTTSVGATPTAMPSVQSQVAQIPTMAPLLYVGADENVNTTASDEEIVCVGGALGYITCPLLDMSAKMIRFIAVLLDVVFNFQALNNDGIRDVWSIFANLANISLAVVFLIVVISQASSIGISNYGVKRMLPRIVAAAILINMSFYVCALAIDVSNVLGHNMMGFIGNLTSDRLAQTNSVAQRTPACQVIGESVGRTGTEVWKWTNPVGWASQIIGVDDNIENAVGGTGGAIGGLFGNRTACSMAIMAVGLMGGISVITLILAVILIAVFIAFITTVALAFMRYTILIFLVILAPLAFAAWVLPGTEGLFKKWWNLFLKLLMIYPIAMFMFGASMFAASVIGAVVSDGGFIAGLFPDSNITQESIDAVWASLQLFIIAMPLFFIPKLFKSMDSITGGIAGKMAAVGSGAALYKMGKRSAKMGTKMGVKAATPYAKYGAIRAIDKIASGDGALSGFVRNARARDIAMRTALAARKEGMEQLAKEEAQRIGATSPGMKKVGGDRYEQILRSQKSTDYNNRVKSIQAGYEPDKDDHDFLEKEFYQSYHSGDGAQAQASLSTIMAGGGPGMNRARDILKNVEGMSRNPQTPLNASVATGINNAVDGSFQALSSKRADIAKGRAKIDTTTGTAVYDLGTVGEAGATQIATHSEKPLFDNYENIPQAEAQTILNSPTLNSNVPNAKARGVIKLIAENKPKPTNLDLVKEVALEPISSSQQPQPRVVKPSSGGGYVPRNLKK